MKQSSYDQCRYFLKDSVRKTIDFSKTDQSRGLPPPNIEKPFKSDQDLVALTPISNFQDLYKIDLQCAIKNRQSCRNYTTKKMSLMDLSFLVTIQHNRVK